jgi:hypothetical protein
MPPHRVWVSDDANLECLRQGKPRGKGERLVGCREGKDGDIRRDQCRLMRLGGCAKAEDVNYDREVTHSQRHHRAALTDLEFAPHGTRIMARRAAGSVSFTCHFLTLSRAGATLQP